MNKKHGQPPGLDVHNEQHAPKPASATHVSLVSAVNVVGIVPTNAFD